MSDFGYLSDLKVQTDETVRCTIYNVVNPDGSNPVLFVVPGTTDNKMLFAALLENAAGAMARGTAPDPAAIERQQMEYRALYPIHVIRGWENVLGSDGQPVPYTVEKGHQFLRALPTWVFVRIRDFCESPTNFLRRRGPQLNGETIAKN